MRTTQPLQIDPINPLEFGYRVGLNPQIDKTADLAPSVRVGDLVKIYPGASIGGPSDIQNNVTIGPDVKINSGALIKDNASICAGQVETHSSDARFLGHNVSIGPNVVLHNEVELGESAIVPTQQTIAHLGHLGTKNRVVTIYGSNLGPRYSVGCQIGVSYDNLLDNIRVNLNTSRESAQRYIPYLGVFQEIGSAVQHAYVSEKYLVDEIVAERWELGLTNQRT